MCGIFGAFDLSGNQLPFSNSIYSNALNAIKHRGPNDEGKWMNANKSVFLGHRRLSIIDLSSSGHQPMSNENDTLQIIFNGEIYNFQEIKNELLLLGHQFKSKTDTEVILHGYEQYGELIVHKLRGMFSFAIYNTITNEIFIARDRLGIKPLYYVHYKNIFLFSSEIKPIFESGLIKKKILNSSLAQYLTFGKVFSPDTIFDGIKKLPSAHYIKINSQTDTLTPIKYWSPYSNNLELPPSTEEQFYIDKTKSLFFESVKLRMLSDVPVGVFLSGGVDSTANVAVMSSISKNVNTFTVGFKGQTELDERKYARKAAEHYKTNHIEFEISKDDFIDLLPEVMGFIDEPINDPTVLPIYFISKLAKENNSIVILNGDGSDELFCGYNKWIKYLKAYKLFSLSNKLPNYINKFFSNIFKSNEVVSDILSRSSKNVELYVGSTGALKGKSELDLIADKYDVYKTVINEKKLFNEEKKTDNYCEWLTYWGIKSEVENVFLYRADRMGMANSIEIRVPFLDHKLVEFATQMPQELKYKNGEKKYILKKALEGIVPNEFLYRKKQGFCVPIQEWASETMTFKIKSILPIIFQETNMLQLQYVHSLIDSLNNPNPDLVWQLYALCVWYENWFLK